MLEERLNMGIKLYEMGVFSNLIMSGNHGTKYYNENWCDERLCDS